MKKRGFVVLVYLVVSVAVFMIGIRSAGGAIGEKTVTCDKAFNNQCSKPGQCSYNVTHGASECVIKCQTKINLNGNETIVPSEAKCGSWKINIPVDPTTGDGTPWESPFWQ